MAGTGMARGGGRLVVGVDASRGAAAALAWAAQEAARRDAELVVLQAFVPQGPMAGPVLTPGPRAWSESIDATRGELAAQVAALCDPAGSGLVTPVVAPGPAVEALREAAVGAALLVVGSSGRGAVREALLGSVSRELARDCPCPLVVVPCPRPADPSRVDPS